MTGKPPPRPAFEGRTVLITGARGFIGSALTSSLSGTDCRLIRASRRPLAEAPNTVAEIEDMVGDLASPDIWRESVIERGAEIIFHLASQTSITVAEDNPALDLEANVLPMLYLLDSCRGSGRLVDVLFAGTATQIGLPERLPVDETHPDRPLSVYDVNKLAAENHLATFAANGAVRGATLRLCNVYGPGAQEGSAERGVLNKTIVRALEGETITVFGDGHELRDYIFIDDVIAAFLAASEAMKDASGCHFVVGTGEGHSLAEVFSLVAERVEHATGRSVPVDHIDWPTDSLPIERRNFVADPTLMREVTGWSARTSLSEGIEQTIAFFHAASD